MDAKEVQAEIQRRVAELRAEGRYPLGLEEQLESEFAAIMEVVHGRADLPDDIGKEISLLRATVEQMRSEFARSGAESHSDSDQSVTETAILALERTVRLYEVLIREFEALRREDERIVRRIEHFLRDRIVMVDVLSQAVVELESRLDEQK